MQFARKNYEEALAYYKKALRMKPDMPACGRLGMACCYFNLGKYVMAEYTYKRMLQLVLIS